MLRSEQAPNHAHSDNAAPLIQPCPCRQRPLFGRLPAPHPTPSTTQRTSASEVDGQPQHDIVRHHGGLFRAATILAKDLTDGVSRMAVNGRFDVVADGCDNRDIITWSPQARFSEIGSAVAGTGTGASAYVPVSGLQQAIY